MSCPSFIILFNTSLNALFDSTVAFLQRTWPGVRSYNGCTKAPNEIKRVLGDGTVVAHQKTRAQTKLFLSAREKRCYPEPHHKESDTTTIQRDTRPLSKVLELTVSSSVLDRQELAKHSLHVASPSPNSCRTRSNGSSSRVRPCAQRASRTDSYRAPSTKR